MPGVGHQVLKLKALLSSNKAATTSITCGHCARRWLVRLPVRVVAGGRESDFKIA
jgi:hypothetical protein